jgi:DNA-binding NtrC family response regulator
LRARTLVVRVAEGPDRDLEHVSTGQTVVVGTSAGADLRLTDGRVSRAHCELAPVSRGVRVRDLNSTNGTYRGDVALQAGVLPAPFELLLGDSRLEVGFRDEVVEPLPSDRTWFGPLIGHGTRMRTLFATLERVAPTLTPILLEGETGVGKTMAAQAIATAFAPTRATHVLSLSDATPSDVEAAFRDAAGGTVIVEDLELGGIDATRVLTRAADEAAHSVRTVATSRNDLRPLLAEGVLAGDLYYRFAAVHLVVPPLRERPEDLRALATRIAASHGQHDWSPSPDFIEALRTEPLPANVRDLEGFVRPQLSAKGPTARALGYKEQRQLLVDGFEEAYIRALLERHGFNISRAAEEAGIARQHLTHLAKKAGLSRATGNDDA